jgi:hypothetical protein
MANAEALALGGDFILDRLANLQIRNARQAAATVRLATVVGGDKALELIKRCALHSGQMVEQELVQAWPHFDPHEYGQIVLADRSIKYLKITDPALLPVLHYPRIASLALEFKRGCGDISELPTLAKLQRLTISDPLLSDLSPLGGMTALQELELRNTAKTSLQHLPKQLTKLELTNYENIHDAKALSEFDNLKAFQVNAGKGSPSVVTGLTSSVTSHLSKSRARLGRFGVWNAASLVNLSLLINVPALDSLNFLLLGRAYSLESIAGIEKWAGTLTGIFLMAPHLKDSQRLAVLSRLEFANLSNTPIRDIGCMAQWPGLRTLHLGGSAVGVPNLAPLRDLGKLTRLFVHGEDDLDLRPLAGKEDLEISVANVNFRRIIGASELGEGSKVINYE